MINGKQLSPAWSPPDEIKRDKPSLPNVIPGGSPANPMGAAAMTLSGGGEYAIHGTNDPRSIGGFVSYGCIRMHNVDVLDLYNRVRLGYDGGRDPLIQGPQFDSFNWCSPVSEGAPKSPSEKIGFKTRRLQQVALA